MNAPQVDELKSLVLLISVGMVVAAVVGASCDLFGREPSRESIREYIKDCAWNERFEEEMRPHLDYGRALVAHTIAFPLTDTSGDGAVAVTISYTTPNRFGAWVRLEATAELYYRSCTIKLLDSGL